MRALIQRVARAEVAVEGREPRRTGRGLLVFLGVSRDDTEEDAQYLVDKVLNLRIFPGDSSHFHLSALDVGAEVMVVSQFTLYADTRRGRRPDFTRAAPPQGAERLYNLAVDLFRHSGLRVETGEFGAYMQVSLVNDGPVTVLVDSADRHRPRRG